MVLFHDHPDNIRMGLTGGYQIRRIKVQSGSENGNVFPHILFLLAFLDGDVHGIENTGADAAEPGGKAVGNGDPFRGQIFQLSKFLCNNRHGSSPMNAQCEIAVSERRSRSLCILNFAFGRIIRPFSPSACSTSCISCRCRRGRDHWGLPFFPCGRGTSSLRSWRRHRCRFPWPHGHA